MIRAYIVTEGTTDQVILQRLLPEEITREVEFVIGRGSYSAQSLARTLLSIRERPVALVIDADTIDEQTINEKRDFLLQLFRPATTTAKFEVFIATPMIESVLFYKKSIVERFLNRKISDMEWELARSQPQKVINEVGTSKTTAIQSILQLLDEEDIRYLRSHQLISQLIEFLTHASQATAIPTS